MTLNVTQKHVLFRLLFTGEEPQMSKVKPKLEPKKRKELLDAGLIELEKRAKAQHIKLTDKGWQWAANNFKEEIPSRLKLMPDILHGLLLRLKAYIDSKNISLPELLGFINDNELEKESEKNFELNEDSISPEQKITNAYLKASNGKWNVRVRLSKLRALLPDINRSDLDRLLLEMQKLKKIVLYNMDDIYNIKTVDEEAAIDIGGFKRHIIYMEEIRNG